MKKLLACILIIVSILSLASCSQSGRGHGRGGDESVKSYNDTEWLNDIHMIENLPSVDFDAQYIRAGSKKELSAYPAVKIIRSANEMSRYLKKETHMSDALVNACQKYDADYFKEQILIIVLLEEGSGSVRHEVEKVGANNGHAVIQIKSIAPEVGTCDMAWWHILIEPEAGVQIVDEEDVTVFLGGRNATENYTVASHSKDSAINSARKACSSAVSRWQMGRITSANWVRSNLCFSVNALTNTFAASASRNKALCRFANSRKAVYIWNNSPSASAGASSIRARHSCQSSSIKVAISISLEEK